MLCKYMQFTYRKNKVLGYYYFVCRRSLKSNTQSVMFLEFILFLFTDDEDLLFALSPLNH